MYKRNTEVRSCSHCCSRKAMSITYPQGVFVALGIQPAMHMRHIFICGLFGFTVFFLIVSHTARFYKKSY